MDGGMDLERGSMGPCEKETIRLFISGIEKAPKELSAY